MFLLCLQLYNLSVNVLLANLCQEALEVTTTAEKCKKVDPGNDLQKKPKLATIAVIDQYTFYEVECNHTWAKWLLKNPWEGISMGMPMGKKLKV